MNPLAVMLGPKQEFEPPDWPPFVEEYFAEWKRTHDRPAGLSDIEARRIFAAGWNAAMHALGQHEGDD